MPTLPYKFWLALKKLDGRFALTSPFHSKATALGRFGTLVASAGKTYRLDVSWKKLFIRPWPRRKALYKMIQSWVPDLGAVPKTGWLVIVWSTDDYWLAEPSVLRVMQTWTDKDEPKRCWAQMEAIGAKAKVSARRKKRRG